MNDLTIGIITAVGLGWMGWISISVIGLLKSNRSEDVADLKQAFKEMEDRVTIAIDKMNLRQDTFIQTEIKELKDIISNAK